MPYTDEDTKITGIGSPPFGPRSPSRPLLPRPSSTDEPARCSPGLQAPSTSPTGLAVTRGVPPRDGADFTGPTSRRRFRRARKRSDHLPPHDPVHTRNLLKEVSLDAFLPAGPCRHRLGSFADHSYHELPPAKLMECPAPRLCTGVAGEECGTPLAQAVRRYEVISPPNHRRIPHTSFTGQRLKNQMV